jgi:hypothetical protein
MAVEVRNDIRKRVEKLITQIASTSPTPADGP